MPEREHESAPRGRHAPPLEVRQDRQRRRLYAAAGAVFARVGYADATAEAIIGAGPRAMERRDLVLTAFARYIDEVNREDAERGAAPRLGSFHDAFAIVGAVIELASRQIRHGEP